MAATSRFERHALHEDVRKRDSVRSQICNAILQLGLDGGDVQVAGHTLHQDVKDQLLGIIM